MLRTHFRRPRPRLSIRPAVEPLEDRLTPATLVNPTTVVYTDIDGDRVTVHVSRGSFADPSTSSANFTFEHRGRGEQLLSLNLDDEFTGGDVTIKADRRRGGDGRVNVGFVNADGVDLGKVRIDGDLGRIIVGDGNPTTPALDKLKVHSLGVAGLATQEPEGNLTSVILGPLHRLQVKSDISNVTILVLPPRDAATGASLDIIKVGGSIRSSTIEADRIGSVSVHGDVVGSADQPTVLTGWTFVPPFPPPPPGQVVKVPVTRVVTVEKVIQISLPDGSLQEVVRRQWRPIRLEITTDHALDSTGRIDRVSVGGRVERAIIAAGASIGDVQVGGDWIASSLAAGVFPGVLPGEIQAFGTAGDSLYPDPFSSRGSRITSVAIAGQVLGTPTTGDQFGFVAEQIGAFRMGGADLPLTDGPGNDDRSLGTTGDVRLHEVIPRSGGGGEA